MLYRFVSYNKHSPALFPLACKYGIGTREAALLVEMGDQGLLVLLPFLQNQDFLFPCRAACIVVQLVSRDLKTPQIPIHKNKRETIHKQEERYTSVTFVWKIKIGST